MTRSTSKRRSGTGVAVTAAALAASVGLAVAGGSGSPASAHTGHSGTTAPGSQHETVMARPDASGISGRQVALRTAMRQLWAQHMEWTYAAVAAFVDGSAGFDATVARLLRNQVDLGNAIKPYYGSAAGRQLTALLTEHIKDAVPVLTAAKAGDTAGLDTAVEQWYRNADQIASFLSSANPDFKPGPMKDMMRGHITQTIAYASDMLQGDRAKAIADYEVAEAHMMQMADMLTAGIVKQFPKRF